MFEAVKAGLNQWEGTLAEPWWHEAEAWREGTWDIHRALMENREPARLSP